MKFLRKPQEKYWHSPPLILPSHPIPLPPPTATPGVKVDKLIQVLQFTDRNAVLLEFDSPEAVNFFKAKNTADHFITSHLCPSAILQPCPHRVVLHFVPCDGSFNPLDMEQLHQIEEDLELPPHSITSASWIKKPELRVPNQKLANIKILCTSAFTAN